jgi:hypothetical protein
LSCVAHGDNCIGTQHFLPDIEIVAVEVIPGCPASRYEGRLGRREPAARSRPGRPRDRGNYQSRSLTSRVADGLAASHRRAVR